MSKLSKEELLGERDSASWSTERMLSVIREFGFESRLEEGLELSKQRRLIDFRVLPGSITARFRDGGPGTTALAIDIAPFQDDVWDSAFIKMSEQAIFSAKLLAGELPRELEPLFLDCGVTLFPSSSDELTVRGGGRKREVFLAALYFLLSSHFDNDPLLLLLLRGRSREQIVLELREGRNRLRSTLEATPGLETEVRHNVEPPLKSQARAFWKLGEPAKELHYSIRADELPASLLRRLDPLPLGGFEADLGAEFEEMYAKVARRAQAFGLGLSYEQVQSEDGSSE